MITRRSLAAASSAILAAGQPLLAMAQADTRSIRIGVLEDMSGVFADLGGPSTVVAARMAVDDFGGKVLGRPVEVLGGDHQNKPDIAIGIARQWYDVDGVGLITGLTNSAVALAVHKLTAEKNRIDIILNAATDAVIEELCSPNGIMWNWTARAIVKATVDEAIRAGGDSWFFITSDYAGGRVMEDEARPIIEAAGGKVLGVVHPPVGKADFSSELLTAQASGAKILGVVTYGQDFANLMKQVGEFGIQQSMQPVAPFTFQSDLRAVGPDVVQGMTVAAPFYWDLNPVTRGWSERFGKLTGGRKPDVGHAGAYTAVTHYLKSIQQAATDKAALVMQAMRTLPIIDMYTDDARIREDGMVVRTIYLFAGKRPSESHGPWDLLRVTGRVDKNAAFPIPPNDRCSLL